MAENFDAFNARLRDACTKRCRAVLRGHTVSIAERMQADLAAFMKLPAAPYDACDKATTRVSSLSLVCYKNNDYSVPARYGCSSASSARKAPKSHGEMGWTW